MDLDTEALHARIRGLALNLGAAEPATVTQAAAELQGVLRVLRWCVLPSLARMATSGDALVRLAALDALAWSGPLSGEWVEQVLGLRPTTFAEACVQARLRWEAGVDRANVIETLREGLRRVPRWAGRVLVHVGTPASDLRDDVLAAMERSADDRFLMTLVLWSICGETGRTIEMIQNMVRRGATEECLDALQLIRQCPRVILCGLSDQVRGMHVLHDPILDHVATEVLEEAGLACSES